MRIGLLRVGRGRDKLLAEVAARYEQRLSRSSRLVTAWVPEVGGRGRSADEIRRLEADRLRDVLSRWGRAVHRTCPVIVLDERGSLPTSRELAAKLQAFAEAATPQISFVIGGDEGLDPSLREEASESLALSRLTFTHEMARVLLLEQLYRAQSILTGHPYHRE